MKTRSRKFIPQKELVSLRFPFPNDSLALINAAYLMRDRAYASLGRTSKGIIINLTPKKSHRVSSIREEFKKEYKNQVMFWTLARQNRKTCLEVYGNAFKASARPHPPAGPERILSGFDRERQDPLGIMEPWEIVRRRR